MGVDDVIILLDCGGESVCVRVVMRGEVLSYVALRRAGILSADGNQVKVHNRRGPLEQSVLYQTGME